MAVLSIRERISQGQPACRHQALFAKSMGHNLGNEGANQVPRRRLGVVGKPSRTLVGRYTVTGRPPCVWSLWARWNVG